MDKISKQESGASDKLAELWAKQKVEPITSFLKLELLELSPSYAKVAMKLTPEHQNFHGMIFGGIIMSVADYAFAYSANSEISPTIASQFNTYLIAAPRVGDELIAECRVTRSGRRAVLCEVVVTNQEGKLIAKAMGTGIYTGPN